MPLRFRLHYRGPLPSAKNARDSFKHGARVKLHPQLESVWKSEDLLNKLEPVTPGAEDWGKSIPLLRQVGSSRFVTLASRDLRCQVGLDFTLLRPSVGGEIFDSKGDIDNRIKSLIDSLRVPTVEELKRGQAEAPPTPTPCYCLMDDDSLVTRFSVVTDRLLAPESDDDVLLIAEVTIWSTSRAIGNPYSLML